MGQRFGIKMESVSKEIKNTQKKKKQKKLTVPELKRKMEVGTSLILVEFHGIEVSRSRTVLGIEKKYAKLIGDGIEDGGYTVFGWPKSSELTGTEDGFIISGKFGVSRYVWK
jgi:hypothetical protein